MSLVASSGLLFLSLDPTAISAVRDAACLLLPAGARLSMPRRRLACLIYLLSRVVALSLSTGAALARRARHGHKRPRFDLDSFYFEHKVSGESGKVSFALFFVPSRSISESACQLVAGERVSTAKTHPVALDNIRFDGVCLEQTTNR